MSSRRVAEPTFFQAVTRSQDPHLDPDDVQAITGRLSDIENLRTRQAARTVPLSDTELAFQLAAEETLNFATSRRDRDLAVRLSMYGDEGFRLPDITPPRTNTRLVSDHPIAGPSRGTNPQAKAPKEPVIPARPSGHNCVICTDPIHGVEVRAPCGDYYDKGCILDLFEAATRDESLFPPRCCRQHIPLESVRPHMSAALVTLFKEKTKEFSTLKRVYCANPPCSRFLGEQVESAFWHWLWPSIRCSAPGCGTSTCKRCKNKVTSTRHRCDTDEQHREVLHIGRTEGWARCPGCAQMIELNHGCYHMTCICKTQFCYLCKARWKTCTCPQWDERRLVAAAEARADAQLGRRAPPPRPPTPPAPRRAAETRADARLGRPAPPPRPPVVARQALPLPPTPPAPRRAAEYMPAHRPAAARVIPREPAAPDTTARRASTVITRRDGLPTREHPNAVTPETRAVEPFKDLVSIDGKVKCRRARPVVPRAGSSVGSPRPVTPLLTRSQPAARPSPSSGATSAAASPATRPQSVLVSVPSPTSRRQAAPPTAATAVTVSNAPADSSKRDTLIKQWVARLRVDHDCQHDSWKYRQGGGRCETCHDHLPIYLFRCKRCEMLACKRCTKNRL